MIIIVVVVTHALLIIQGKNAFGDGYVCLSVRRSVHILQLENIRVDFDI
jgi:hypothetical protein